MADLLGLRIAGAIDNKAAATGTTGGGWPNAGKAMINSTEYASIAAAIAAAAAGDIIKVGQGTFTETLTVDEVVTLVALDPTLTIITSASSATITVTSAGAAFRNLGIRNTAGGGTDSTIIQSNVNNCVYENCILTKTGAADDSACILQYGGTGTQILGCELTTTGATKNYAIWNNTATATIEVRGGKLSGSTQDIFGDQAGSTILLVKPVLVNNLISFSGTISGDYLDNSGNIRQVVATNDIYLGGDEGGQKERNVNIFLSTITDHFDAGTFSANWAWAAYAGFVTPATIDVTSHNSMAAIGLSTAQSPARAFAYYNAAVNELLARCQPLADMRAGIRLDDGTNSNYFELFLEYQSGGLLKLRHRSAAASVVTGPTDDWGGVSAPIQFFVLRAFRTASVVNYHYAINGPRRISVGSVAATWTVSRSGMYIENLSATGGSLDRTAVFDWYKQL